MWPCAIKPGGSVSRHNETVCCKSVKELKEICLESEVVGRWVLFGAGHFQAELSLTFCPVYVTHAPHS